MDGELPLRNSQTSHDRSLGPTVYSSVLCQFTRESLVPLPYSTRLYQIYTYYINVQLIIIWVSHLKSIRMVLVSLISLYNIQQVIDLTSVEKNCIDINLKGTHHAHTNHTILCADTYLLLHVLSKIYWITCTVHTQYANISFNMHVCETKKWILLNERRMNNVFFVKQDTGWYDL